MAGPVFTPVMEPYEVRVIASLLARAFNPDAAEVPPTRSPMWPIAQRMASDMRVSGYQLGAFATSEVSVARPRPGGAPPGRTISVVGQPRTARQVDRPRAGYGHAAALLAARAE